MQALIPVAIIIGRSSGKLAGKLALAAGTGFAGAMGSIIATHAARHPKVTKLLLRLSNPAAA